jgi:hypothetical protein
MMVHHYPVSMVLTFYLGLKLPGMRCSRTAIDSGHPISSLATSFQMSMI